MQRVAVSEPGAVRDRVVLHSVMVIFHSVYCSPVDPVATASGSDIEKRPLFVQSAVNLQCGSR